MNEQELNNLKKQISFYKVSGISDTEVKELGYATMDHFMILHMQTQTQLLVAILEELKAKGETHVD